MTELLKLCLKKWNCEVECACNFEASQQKKILRRRKENDISIVLRGGNGKYFIEEYRGKEMYPAVYKVLYTEKDVELTEEDYKKWLNEKLKNS